MTQTTVDTAVIANAVGLACRAPSLHNSQPWRWVAGSAVVDLFVDPHRMLTSADSSGREAVISCGALLDHFQVAMAAAGWATNIDQFPNPNNLDHLASIDFAAMDCVAGARHDRADAISLRRTDRRPFRAPKDWASLEPVLRTSVDGDAVQLAVLTEDARPRLVEASRLTESLRRYDDCYHHELNWWTAPLRESEGIPPSALASGSAARGVGVNRSFPADWRSEHSSASRQDQAKIVVLSTPEYTRADALRCGRALSAILLECTLAGLGTCPVTHVTEMEASRDIVRDLTGGTGEPQLLIRIGAGPSGDIPAPTPRRPLGEVLEIRR
ncbi:Putative NAD(P)H nitroreductase acg [Mycobacterium basiliense]|uniref:NAD(P)H nitroreductase acg n=1 Tax=Mycobacterium basiliense TaxID=2094119 RepID=A0A3S4FP10_9MYCO|nr:nitroreductase family protein [Mycobacterium basiliense]VDM89528.1 Putative NAD(P)H nitroreductase acg [Mycobacterium basiliense]